MLDHLRLQDAQTIWTLETESPVLWNRLLREYPWLESASADLKRGCPVGPSLEPFDQDDCVRPPRHMRAFYVKHSDGPVLAVKGSEVVDEHLERAFRRFYSVGERWTPLEEFPLHEQKLGLAVYVEEAVNEAEITVQFQEEYLRAFDSLAAFPIHLMVYRFPQDVVDSYFATVEKFASDRAKHQSRLLGQNGLAAYVYFFPHLPLRVAHSVPSSASTGIVDARTRDAVLKKTCGLDPRSATEAYLTLASRMLALGFFPLSMASFGIGYCTSAQNVTVKGAMVDAESLYPFSKVKSNWEFGVTFLTSLASLCATTKVLLYTPLPNVRFEFRDPSAISILLSDFVWTLVRKEIALCASQGVQIDPRLERLLAPASLEKIRELVFSMHPECKDLFLAAHAAGHDNRGWD